MTPEQAKQLETLVKIVVGGFAIMGAWAAFGRFVKECFSGWSQRRQAAAIKRKKLQGHYDANTIDNATRHYIWPDCTNSDPAHQDEIRALVTTREDLRSKVDEFLEKRDSKRHLFILADSGTGKTSFLLNYFAFNLRRPRWQKRHNIALIHLGSPDCDERIQQIENPDETVLFLDALDEDVIAVKGHGDRIRELMTQCDKFSHIVITCRTQFFPSDEEIPKEAGVARIDPGPRSAGESGVFKFWRLYLSPLSDTEVRQYICRRFPIWRFWKRKSRRDALAFAAKIPALCARPMLLAHIPDIVKSRSPVRTVSDLYEVMIDGWIERESAWTDKVELRKFSERLAVEIYTSRDTNRSERIPGAALPELALRWDVSLEPWQLTGRSLLNRDAEGNFKFAHRSIMEYLVANNVEKARPNHYVLTDMMCTFMSIRLGLSIDHGVVHVGYADVPLQDAAGWSVPAFDDFADVDVGITPRGMSAASDILSGDIMGEWVFGARGHAFVFRDVDGRATRSAMLSRVKDRGPSDGSLFFVDSIDGSVRRAWTPLEGRSRMPAWSETFAGGGKQGGEEWVSDPGVERALHVISGFLTAPRGRCSLAARGGRWVGMCFGGDGLERTTHLFALTPPG